MIDQIKWRGILLPALRKVQKQVQPLLTVNNDALSYLEALMLNLMQQLCHIQPHSIADVATYINNNFHAQIKDWAQGSADAAVEKRKKRSLKLPVNKLFPLIQKEIVNHKIDYSLATYIVAVLEYLSADILKLAGNYVRNIRNLEITYEDVKVAMSFDKVLADLFHTEVAETMISQPMTKKRSGYIEVFKDFLMAEERFVRELNLIIKVFREKMVSAVKIFTEEDLELIFSNLVEIHEFATTCYTLMESAFEMSDTHPLLGDLFEEMVEAAEFECFETYAYSLSTELTSYKRAKQVIERPECKIFFQQHGLYDTSRYILPKLLHGPIYHCADLFEHLNLLIETTPDEEDKEKLLESVSGLRGIQVTLEKLSSQPPLKQNPEDQVFHATQLGMNELSKIQTIEDNIEGWDGKAINQVATVYLKEGTLSVGRRRSRRTAFLFDTLLVLTKPNNMLAGFSQAEYRYKEHVFIRKAEIKNVYEEEFSFEIVQKDEAPLLVNCADENEKFEWLSLLMMLNQRSTLDRMLDAILQEEQDGIQLKTPDPSVYIFSEEDTEENILFEDTDEDVAVIKGGKLHKLVERMTYHKHADPAFVRTFLTTYRSFSHPAELLELLIQRYDIPDPTYDPEHDEKQNKEVIKKFRKEYSHPIQIRVLNVLRHWVDNHFYDFQREEQLLVVLQKFLSRVVRSKAAKKWVESIEKIVNRRLELGKQIMGTYTFDQPPPPFAWHLTEDFNKFSILTLHPLEIGRQLTIMQSEIFRAIRPSELVGTVWTKKDKEKLSPNTLKIIRLSTLLTYWYELSICEAKNFDERVAVYGRIIDVLKVFLELNNFNGMMEILSALNSAPVFRLHHTKGVEFSPKRVQALQEANSLADGHNVKYLEKLRSINPPCVPFLGIYLSNILKAEEGNPDNIRNSGEALINFSKRRMVAEITGEIQNYQNMPYNLDIEPSIRRYLEEIDPLEGRSEKEVNDYLYQLSLEIEPRNSKQPNKYARKTDWPLKTPGVKQPHRQQSVNRKSLPSTDFDTTNRKSLPSNEFDDTDRPPSPSPSLASTFFVVNESENESEPEEECAPPPPLPLPRLPVEEHDLPAPPMRQTSPDKPVYLSAPPLLPRCRIKQTDGSVNTDFGNYTNCPPPPPPPRKTPLTPTKNSPPSLPSRASKPSSAEAPGRPPKIPNRV